MPVNCLKLTQARAYERTQLARMPQMRTVLLRGFHCLDFLRSINIDIIKVRVLLLLRDIYLVRGRKNVRVFL